MDSLPEKGTVRPRGIYVSSRLKHAEMWKEMRSDGIPIISTWIDQAQQGEVGNFAELWVRIEREIRSASCLVFYARNEDFPYKGALVEVGMALAVGTPVFLVLNDVRPTGETMRPIGSWMLDLRVRHFNSIEDAIWAAREMELQHEGM